MVVDIALDNAAVVFWDWKKRRVDDRMTLFDFNSLYTDR